MSIKEKVLFKVSTVSAGNIANAVMGFVFLTAVARSLSLDTFGKYALLTSLLTLIARIMDFGTNSLFVSDHGDKDKRATFLFSKLLLFCVALPLSIITLSVFHLNAVPIVVIFIAGLFAYTINFTLYAYYQKSQRYLEAVLLNTIPSIIKVFYTVAIFLNYVKLDLNNAFAIFTYSIFGSLLVYILFPIKIFDKNDASFLEAVILLKKAVSPGVSQLIYESWSTVNNALTKFYNTFSDVGIFSMANKISNIFYLLPKNTERKTDKKSYDFHETGILSIAVFIMSLAAIVISEIFLTRVFRDKFNESMKFLVLLIFANAITAVQNFVENYFYVEKYTKYLVTINVTKLVLLIAIAAVTIPVYGLTSLAVANLIAAFVGITITFVLIRRIEKSKSLL